MDIFRSDKHSNNNKANHISNQGKRGKPKLERKIKEQKQNPTHKSEIQNHRLWRSLLPWQQSCQIFKLRSLNDPIWRHDDGPQSHAGLIWFSPTLFSKKLVFCLQAHKIASSRSSFHHHKSCGGREVYCGVLCKSHMSHNRDVTVQWQSCGAASKQL